MSQRDSAWWRANVNVTSVDSPKDFYAECPSCGGSRLHITDKRGKDALLNCFTSGCEYAEILAAIEDDAAPLAVTHVAKAQEPPQDPAAAADPMGWWAEHCGVPRSFLGYLPIEARGDDVAFTFDGIAATKLRSAGSKRFSWNPNGVAPPLWPIPLRDMPRGLILTEGEADATLMACSVVSGGMDGLIAVHGVTKGADSAVPVAVWRELRSRGLRDVMVLFDEDEAGRKGATANVATATEAGLRATTVRIAGLDPLLGEKDARDVWTRTLARLVDPADEAGFDLAAPDASLIQTMAEYASDVPDSVPWVVEGLVYRGGVTLLAGPPKGGKSTLLADVQRCVLAGEPFLDTLAVASASILLLTEERGIAVTMKSGTLPIDVLDHATAIMNGLDFAGSLDYAARWADDSCRRRVASP